MATQGLNTKERQRSVRSSIYVAALLTCPTDLMDVLFVNHQYGSIHWGWVRAFGLGAVATLLLIEVARMARPLLRVAMSLFLCVCAATAMLSRFGVQTQDARVIGKVVIAVWWGGLLLMMVDWISAKVSKPSTTFTLPAREVKPDPRADEARRFVLDRLFRQAASERITLSELELQFLDYSRISTENRAMALEEEFFQTHDYTDFKQLVRTLTGNAVKHDRETDAAALKQYYRRLRDLKRGKHDQQMVLFIERGILDGRTGIEELRDYALYILIGLSVVAIPVALIFRLS